MSITSPTSSTYCDLVAAPSAGNANPQANLLDLLRFGPANSSQTSSQQQQSSENPKAAVSGPDTHSVHGRGISASDLIASVRGSTSKPSTPAQPSPRSGSAAHQDSLLKLLNQATLSGKTDNQKSRSSSKAEHKAVDTPHSGRTSSPIRYFGSKETTPTPFQPEAIAQASPSAKNEGIFTYVNPFEQLSASSPLNAQARAPPSGDMTKRKVKSPSPPAAVSYSRRKLTPSGGEVLQSIESPGPEPLKDGRTQIEALMGIGAPRKDVETVADALNEVGGQVHKQMEHALAEAEEHGVKQEDQSKEGIQKDVPAFASGEDKENMAPAEETKAKGKDATTNAAVDEWESADEEKATLAEPRRKVPTYQFPMRPFVCIDVNQGAATTVSIRDDAIVNIARFKKDFDQTDRTLATATKDFIVYGMPKTGGVRIIQQENGTSSLLFPKTEDRIFNVATSTAPAGTRHQQVIATGVSGAAYWTTIKKPDMDFDQRDMESKAVIFPPTITAAEAALSAQLKTRAKRSSRHPQFFAIGRGKSIQIVFPMHARKSEYFKSDHTLDTEAYFSERNLKITTGKAPKDFSFSEDDSAIATLDKAGKLRIWDTRDLIVEENGSASRLAAIEVRNPLMTLSTTNAAEKTWPTSVLFVDKTRSYTKGIAQRYIIVGMKQNHTLQLWDLHLGKAVQELSFPHENETDAICSVAYHPATSVIAVGHPTRNSIYLIHLSAPKYNLTNMSQAKFIQRLASKDSTLAKAESTAIMSGLHEYSLGDIGQLRSLDLVPSANEVRGVEDDESLNLFELYVMHSKGVTCLGFKREDLGLSIENKALHSIDAQAEALITVRDLKEPSAPALSVATTMNGDAASSGTPPKASKAARKDVQEETALVAAHSSPSKPAGKADKADKKKAKTNGTSDGVTKAVEPPPALPTASEKEQPTVSPTPQPPPIVAKPADPKQTSAERPAEFSTVGERSSAKASADPVSAGISSDFLNQEMKKIEQGVAAEFNKAFQHELDALYRRLDSDKQVQNAASGANQEAILRLVSKQLGDNVEKSLASIVTRTIKESVTPYIGESTASSLDKILPHIIGQQLQALLPMSLKPALHEVVGHTMQSADVYRAISEKVTKSVTGQVEREFASALNSSVIPAFKNLTISTVQKIGQDTENRVKEQLQRAETQHRNDGARIEQLSNSVRVLSETRREDTGKIDQLTNAVRVLSETIHQMAAAQSDFQSEILKLQQRAYQDGHALARRDSLTPSESASMQMSPEQQEIEAIAALMQKNDHEGATIMVSSPLCF